MYHQHGKSNWTLYHKELEGEQLSEFSAPLELNYIPYVCVYLRNLVGYIFPLGHNVHHFNNILFKVMFFKWGSHRNFSLNIVFWFYLSCACTQREVFDQEISLMAYHSDSYSFIHGGFLQCYFVFRQRSSHLWVYSDQQWCKLSVTMSWLPYCQPFFFTSSTWFVQNQKCLFFLDRKNTQN